MGTTHPQISSPVWSDRHSSPTRVLPGKAAFVETKIGAFERGVSAVYYSIVGLLLGAAGLIRMLAPGTLT